MKPFLTMAFPPRTRLWHSDAIDNGIIYDNFEKLKPHINPFLHSIALAQTIIHELCLNHATPRRTGSTEVDSVFLAVQILLIASVRPTSFVSNSKNPTATVNVAVRKPHQNKALVLGNLLVGM